MGNNVKKIPAPKVVEQVKKTTIEYLKDSIKIFGIPKEILIDNYKLATSNGKV